MELEEIADRAALTEVPREVLRDRYRGTMVGLAIGNALGLEQEGWSAEHIRQRFPDGIRAIDPGERDRPWDDDLAQAALLAEALLGSDNLDAADLSGRLIRWFHENGRGIGLLTAEVISEMERGTPEPARVAWERSGRRSAGNGAVMRCAPVALRWRRSGALLVREARSSALVTHHDPRCEWSTVAVVVALAVALSGARPDLHELAEAVDEAGAPSDVGTHVRRAAGSDLESFVLDDAAMGYTLKAMQVGLWSLLHNEDPKEALVRVVSAGGDTDTNGAVAGAALGASPAPPRGPIDGSKRSETPIVSSKWRINCSRQGPETEASGRSRPGRRRGRLGEGRRPSARG